MKKSLAYTCLFWLLIVDLASAGDYVLVLGKGFEVCEAHLKNLNAFPDHPPMVCDRPLNPKVEELKKPEWQPLPVLEHLDLLRQVEQTLRGMTDEQWEAQKGQWAEKVKERVAKGWLSLSTSELDVDRDGTLERVLRDVNDTLGCDPKNQSTFANPGGIKLLVLTPDQRGIDAWKNGNFNLLGRRHEVFLYKGRVYLTGWVGNLRFMNGELWVTSPAHLPGMDKQACKFAYKPAKQRRNP
jgi:hypothetical protein